MFYPKPPEKSGQALKGLKRWAMLEIIRLVFPKE
jgi:hypothetical protein